QYASCPFSSALIRDCLERGKDAANGGARYNFVYPCFPGFVNVIDSLAAVKQAVYEEKTLTLAETYTMIAENFRDYEKERLYLLNRCAKFGNDLPEADAIAYDFYRFIYDELSRYKTCLGGTFHPSYFAWVMHGHFGKNSAATPDGRLAGTALSECLGAAQGRDRNGPTAVMRSISPIDQSLSIGGIATNFRFTKSLLAGKAGQAALASFIRAFFAGGNFECQFNAVSQKDLLDAQKNPENYQSLQVRVAGYSDYFVNLDPVIQNEVIMRTEHDAM
ncbi:MAG TPA: formate C-acetyltransferase/glycerol dehydratase family glycyl radical enzyme, partial [Clostridiales bacterium]|nr:formate C-acetyltransferase/glycerol dehydratase family glycyl radical enzyme [Clostridiales bacterium]